MIIFALFMTLFFAAAACNKPANKYESLARLLACVLAVWSAAVLGTLL